MSLSRSKKLRQRKATLALIVRLSYHVIRVVLLAVFLHRCYASYQKWSNPRMMLITSQEIIKDQFIPPQVVICPELHATNMNLNWTLQESYHGSVKLEDLIIRADIMRNYSNSPDSPPHLQWMQLLDPEKLAMDGVNKSEVWEEDVSFGTYSDFYQDLNKCFKMHYPKPILQGRNGKMRLIVNADLVKFIHIYINERDRFMPTLSSTYESYKPLMVPIEKDAKGNLEGELVLDYTVLTKKRIRSEKCSPNPDAYHQTKSLLYKKLMNCTPFWDIDEYGGQRCPDSLKTSYIGKLFHGLVLRKGLREVEKHGIQEPCDTISYSFTERFREVRTMRDHVVRLKLTLDYETRPVEQEVPSYDGADFIADVGGYLGLLLGISILSIVDSGYAALKTSFAFEI